MKNPSLHCSQSFIEQSCERTSKLKRRILPPNRPNYVAYFKSLWLEGRKPHHFLCIINSLIPAFHWIEASRFVLIVHWLLQFWAVRLKNSLLRSSYSLTDYSNEGVRGMKRQLLHLDNPITTVSWLRLCFHWHISGIFSMRRPLFLLLLLLAALVSSYEHESYVKHAADSAEDSLKVSDIQKWIWLSSLPHRDKLDKENI